MIDSSEEFIRLRSSKDKEEYDRAAYDEAPLDVWWDIVTKHPDMRIWVVHNKTVPISILDALSHDSDPIVRRAVATKRKLSLEIFERLACDADPDVRHCLVWNAKVPSHILRGLLKDECDHVSSTARARLAEREGGSG